MTIPKIPEVGSEPDEETLAVQHAVNFLQPTISTSIAGTSTPWFIL